MEPAPVGGRGAGPDPGPHRVQHLGPRGGRHLRRRLRHRRPDARAGGDRHPGARERDGRLGAELPREVPARDHGGGGRVPHQRSVARHRAPQRLHRGDSHLPRGADRGVVRVHDPRGRHRGAGLRAGREAGLRGRSQHPHPPPRKARRVQLPGARDRARERPQSGRGRGGPLLARGLQRGRGATPRGHDERVRACRPRRPRPLRHRHVARGDAGRDPRPAARHVPELDADRRIRAGAGPGRRGDHRRYRDVGRLRRHLGGVDLRDQRPHHLHRGVCELRGSLRHRLADPPTTQARSPRCG